MEKKIDKKNDIKNRLRHYTIVLSRIEDLELQIEQINSEISISGLDCSKEKITGTNKITSETEEKAIKLIEDKQALEIKISKDRTEIKRLDNSIKVLEDSEKQIIRMRYIEKISYKEVQMIMRMSEKTLGNCTSRALCKMEKILYGK